MMSDVLSIPSALLVDTKDKLSPENILVMVASEFGCVAETGFSKNQYIIKRPAKDWNHIKTLYCSARINGDSITFTGAATDYMRLALCDPKFFDKLGKLLSDIKFMMTSAKDFDSPLSDGVVF